MVLRIPCTSSTLRCDRKVYRKRSLFCWNGRENYSTLVKYFSVNCYFLLFLLCYCRRYYFPYWILTHLWITGTEYRITWPFFYCTEAASLTPIGACACGLKMNTCIHVHVSHISMYLFLFTRTSSTPIFIDISCYLEKGFEATLCLVNDTLYYLLHLVLAFLMVAFTPAGVTTIIASPALTSWRLASSSAGATWHNTSRSWSWCWLIHIQHFYHLLLQSYY